MPRFLGLLHADASTEAEVMPDPELFVKMGTLMEEITKGIKADEVWILGYLKAFCKEILPAVVVEAGKAKAAGQDQATAVSIAFGVPIEVATAFVASSELMNQGLNDTQIAEIFIAGVKGESAEDIMKRYGPSDEKPEGV